MLKPCMRKQNLLARDAQKYAVFLVQTCPMSTRRNLTLFLYFHSDFNSVLTILFQGLNKLTYNFSQPGKVFEKIEDVLVWSKSSYFQEYSTECFFLSHLPPHSKKLSFHLMNGTKTTF